jgi:selenocysteine-specific elongation factor
MRPKSVVIGTAGHIDHGKTALIRALTGTDTDRLPEEKRRGITVDLGFASLDAEAPDGAPLRLSFIDVPGHALFVRNMLAGAGGIDAVMLVISAEEGVKPQTEEHLAICRMLGIERGLTVITKIDAVSETRLGEVRRAIEKYLSDTFLRVECAPVIAVSAHSDAGMESLRLEVARLAAQIPARNREALARLPLDRAFTMKGFGTVVTGTLIAGTLKTGQLIAIEPGTRTARIRGIQVHGRAEEMVCAGSRVALNLAGIETGELRRGDTLVEGGSIAAVDMIDTEVDLLPGVAVLKHRARTHFHAFAAECMASASLYGYEPVEPGSKRLMRLRLSKAIVLLPGDKFVIRAGSPVSTIGGGRVLDVHPIERLRKAACQSWLQKLEEAPAERAIAMRVARRGVAGISISALSTETGMRGDALDGLLQPRIREGSLVRVAGDLLLTCESLEAAARQVVSEFERRTQEHPVAGLKRSELKSQTKLGAEVLDSVLKRLERDKKLVIQNEIVRPFNLEGEEASADRERLAAICGVFEAAGLTAPSPDEVGARLGVGQAEMRRLMTILLREKKVVRLGNDALCVYQGALAELLDRVRALSGQKIDVTGFKELTGLSRKYAIPLLEYLDRERITRKQGEFRIVL